jgi:proliferating cell nuclear antigen
MNKRSFKENADVIMELRTIQTSVIKNLFESIKEILVDINLVFSANTIQCTAIDGSKSACVHFRLETDKFEYYFCQEEDVIIGINMASLYKLIKPITNGDIIIMKIARNDKFRLQIVIENAEKRTRTTSSLKLLDIDQQLFSIPDVQFDNVITMPCNDFQRHCKDMLTVSDKVMFECTPHSLTMTCNGDFADFTIQIQRSHETESVTPTNIGTFSLKFINLFIKSSSLCTNVEIYLKKEYPLILVYKIGSLGKLQFVLAPEYEEEEMTA